MFLRKGQALGSVLHSAVPEASAEPEPVPEPVLDSVVRELETTDSSGITVDSVGYIGDQDESVEVEADSGLEPPKLSASKADWVAFAVAQGVDEVEAQALTRSELIELYGGEDASNPAHP